MRPHVSLVLMTAASSCLPAAGDSGVTTTTRDSSGIRIVENSGDRIAPWRIAIEPMVSIGGLNGDPAYELFNVQNAIRLSDGTIVIANQGSFEIRFYDSLGLHLRSIGREGDGPGEFGYLSWIHLLGDTILAFDSRGVRFSFYSLTGQLLGTDRLRGTDDVATPWPQGMFEDGTALVGGPGKSSPAGRGLWHDTRSYYRYDLRQATTVPVRLEQRIFRFYEKFGPSGLISIPILFGSTQEVHVDGREIYEVNSDEFQVRVYDSVGQLRTIIRKHHVRAPISSEELDLAKERLHKRSRHEAIQKAVIASFDDMPIPSVLPALGLRAWDRVPSPLAPKSSILIDDVGNIWVLEFNRLAVEADRWTVFAADGTLIGSLELPPRFQPLHIGDGVVLGLTRDEDEVEFVRIHAIAKGRP